MTDIKTIQSLDEISNLLLNALKIKLVDSTISNTIKNHIEALKHKHLYSE